ncbi:single-stranded DNA-binding protein [Streptomyces sp. AM8-1-1]|uniref:single-stranded DNA-binding protein n=1 Tax=Streptomyces sp. AM8-1-1 TaxID=3075825 RepID=UPI0028C4D213|nr:single-stranded DNA-binding protein [Streptomyces sp. AM8-1-1]WNO74503.1 single-stranded DNA-binding protein [Streptomyces sp. AM8-1-1]
MNDTTVTVVGNVATNVDYRETASGGVARFRIAVTPRRWDRQSASWTDGYTSFYTVVAWRTLAINLAGSVSVGDPLLVHGRLRIREEDRDGYRTADAGGPRNGQREGQRRTFVDIEAVAVGHDLTRGTSAFRRVVKAAPKATESVRERSVQREVLPVGEPLPESSGPPPAEVREGMQPQVAAAPF